VAFGGGSPLHANLPGGAIAGVVVGVLFGVAFIAGFVVLILVFVRRHREGVTEVAQPLRFEGEPAYPAEPAKAAHVGGGGGGGAGGMQEIDGRQVKLTNRAPPYPGLDPVSATAAAAPLPLSRVPELDSRQAFGQRPVELDNRQAPGRPPAELDSWYGTSPPAAVGRRPVGPPATGQPPASAATASPSSPTLGFSSTSAGPLSPPPEAVPRLAGPSPVENRPAAGSQELTALRVQQAELEDRRRRLLELQDIDERERAIAAQIARLDR
jgi:hypothetical protein